MRFERSSALLDRLLWYVAGTLDMAGGGERLIMEGVKYFESVGVKATLLLDRAMPNGAAFFDGAYAPRVQVLDAGTTEPAKPASGILGKAVRRLGRIWRRTNAMSHTVCVTPTLLIANSPEECRQLWFAGLLTRRLLRPDITFIHGSWFQFAEDRMKYAFIFRRRFRQIRDSDPVYREMIPDHVPPMRLIARLKMEWSCLSTYWALRIPRFVLVHSQKNRREVELLFNLSNVVVIPAGGFSRAELGYRPKQNMKAVLGLQNCRVVLSICRLIPKKRVDLAIRAFARLVMDKRDDQYVMVIGGTGADENRLRELCRTLRIDSLVRFIGFVPESQLRDWYHSSDVFVSTDNADYDLSVMLALGLGCKVVLTTQYDVPQCLHSMRRYIFTGEPAVTSLARVMASALTSSPRTLDAEDLKELDELTWEQYFAKLLALTRSTSGVTAA